MAAENVNSVGQKSERYRQKPRNYYRKRGFAFDTEDPRDGIDPLEPSGNAFAVGKNFSADVIASHRNDRSSDAEYEIKDYLLVKPVKFGSAFFGFQRRKNFFYLSDLFFYDNYPLEEAVRAVSCSNDLHE